MRVYKVVARKKSDLEKYAVLAVFADNAVQAGAIVEHEMGDHLIIKVMGSVEGRIYQIGGNVIAIGGTLAERKEG